MLRRISTAWSAAKEVEEGDFIFKWITLFFFFFQFDRIGEGVEPNKCQPLENMCAVCVIWMWYKLFTLLTGSIYLNDEDISMPYIVIHRKDIYSETSIMIWCAYAALLLRSTKVVGLIDVDQY